MKSARKNPGRSKLQIADTEPTPGNGTLGEGALDSFLKSASHELANMLGTVMGELDYGLSNPNPTVKSRAMTVALQAAERARSLARNLSYFALHPNIQSQSFSVTQLLNDTLELTQTEFSHRRIRTQVAIEPGVTAQGDPGALQQSLLNIFRRSLSTMPQGGTLSLTLSRKPDGIELVCRDNGVGIAETRLHGLLNPDFSANRQMDPNDLELFVTRVLAEKQSVRFDVKSSPGIGTTYTLRLPTAAKKLDNYVELRRYRRVGASLGVELGFSGKAPFRAEMETLSVGGCYLRVTDSQAVLPAKESVGSLRIFYYQDQILDIHRCRIASISTPAGAAGMGIEFLEVDPKAEKVLRAIVHSHGFQNR